MARRGKVAAWSLGALAAAVVVAAIITVAARRNVVAVVNGVVLTADRDPAKQTPIPGVAIAATARGGTVEATSDASGAFRLKLRERLWTGESIRFEFRHAGYDAIEQQQRVSNRISVVRMTAVMAYNPEPAQRQAAQTMLSDVRVRYATKAINTADVGSVAKTFEVENTGDIPCQSRPPCSPDGRWKATIRNFTVDAGEGQEFHNARVSCIAGPCPFTRIESDGFSKGGRVITVSVRNWSDTTTFLMEAEVRHSIMSDLIRQSYPALFGRVISFTLPADAEGPSIEAEVNGQEITFPLGPELLLTWAECEMKMEADKTKLYTCELRPGFQFKS